MVSLDKTSLFTNVPVEDVLNFIDRHIQNNRIQVPIPHEVFMSLLRLCVEGTVFEFESLFFRQRHGIAMGSPMSPGLAGLCMEYFECELLSTLSPAPPLCLRYVDDVLLIWPYGEDFESFLCNSLLSGTRREKYLSRILLLTDYLQASASRFIANPHNPALICVIFQDTVTKSK